MDQQSSSSRLPPIQTLLPSSSYPVDDQVATAAASLLQIRGSPISVRPPTLPRRFLSFPDVQPSFTTYSPTFPKSFSNWKPQQLQQYRFIPQTKTEYQYREPSIAPGPSYLPQSLPHPQHLQPRYAYTEIPDTLSPGRKRKRSSLSGTFPRPHSVWDISVNDKGKLVKPVQAVEESRISTEVAGNYSEDTNWEMRCICGLNVDDGFTIQCESCHVWQHAACFKIQPNSVPEVYLCEKCHPRQVDAHWANVMQSERLGIRQKRSGMEKKKRNRAGSAPHYGAEQENMHALREPDFVNGQPTMISPFAPAPSFHSTSALHRPSSTSPGRQEHLAGMTRDARVDVQPAFSNIWRGVSDDGESEMSPITSSIPMLVPHTTSDSEMSAPTPTTLLHLWPVQSSSCTLRALYPVARQSHRARRSHEATSNGTCINESSPQYDQYDIPKHDAHSMPSALTLFLDEKGIDDDTRLVGRRKQPNAVLRPLVCGKKKQNVNGIDDPGITSKVDPSDMRAGEPEVAFGVFALRDLKADEEIVLGWEWEDRHVVHELPRLLKEGYGSGRENVKQSMGEVLSALFSSFTTCACGSSAHNCAIMRMEKHISLERDRDECERAAIASLLQHRVSSLRDQPQQADDTPGTMQMDTPSQKVESRPVSDVPHGSVDEAVQSICMVHDGKENLQFGENKLGEPSDTGLQQNTVEREKVVKGRGSAKHVHFPQSESESTQETWLASTNGVEEQRPRKKVRTASPQPLQKPLTVESAKEGSIPPEETKRPVKEPLKELNTAIEVDQDYQQLNSSHLLTVTQVPPLLSPSTALANLSIQCAMDKEKIDHVEDPQRTANDTESSEMVPLTPSTSISKPPSTNTSSPENYTPSLLGHSDASRLSPKPEHLLTGLSPQLELEHKAVSAVVPLLPPLVANTNSSFSDRLNQIDSSVVPETCEPLTSAIPSPLVVQDAPLPDPPPPPKELKKPVLRRRTLADWKNSKDKEREALKQQERETKEREAKKHDEVVVQSKGSQEEQRIQCAIEIIPSQSFKDMNGMFEQVAEIVPITGTENWDTDTQTNPEGPVDVQMLDAEPLHLPVGLENRLSLLNESAKDTEMMDINQRDKTQQPTRHTSHTEPLLPSSEQMKSMSEDGEICSSSPLLHHPPPPLTSQPRPPSRSITPVSHSLSRESSRPPSRLSSGVSLHPTVHSPSPRSPPRHPRSYRPPSPHANPSYSSRSGHQIDNRYSSRPSPRPPPVGPRALRNGPPFGSSYHPRGYSRPPPSGPPPSGRDRYISQRPYDMDGERGWSSRRGSSRGGGFDDRGRIYSRNNDRPAFER